MLVGSWALAHSRWLALRRSAQGSRERAYYSASLFHANRIQGTHYTTKSDNLERSEASEADRIQVFEDFADEYEAVASTSKPRGPSLLEIIDTTLPAKLPPPWAGSSSIFEDESSEYNSISLASSNKQSINEAVLRLLAEEKHDEAYNLVVEMGQLGYRIYDHRAYEAAALAALDDTLLSRTVSEQIVRFKMFFSLIPSSKWAEGKRTFRAIRKRILDNPLVNMDLVIHFSLILIRKGYMNLVQKHCIPVITRFAPSDVCLQFVDDGILSIKGFWMSQRPSDGRNAIIQSWNFRSTAVHWLAFSNRIEEALSLLPREGSSMDEFRLSRKTHALLRFRLERSSKPEHQGLRSYVDNLLNNSEYTAVQDDPSDLVIASVDPPVQVTCIPVQHFYPRLEQIDEVVSQIDRTITALSLDALATSLLRLKNAYITASSPGNLFTKPPPLQDVLGYFTSYQAHAPHRNGRAIGLLRHRVLRLGPGAASHYLYAEMLHYYRIGRPDLVIETYVDHFYISAVPKEDVLAHYHEFCRRREAELKAGKSAGDSLPLRIGIRKTNPMVPRIRLWPTTGHTSLVWHALTVLAEDDNSILQLYQKLLQISAEGYPSLSTGSPANESYSSPLVPPTTWDAKVPAAAFTPFLRRMLRTSDGTTSGSLGASLLGDMVRAGIKPNVHHLTEIARFYAEQGDSRRAFMIMDRMEAAEKEKTAAASRAFPAPDIVFYCALLRGFIQAGNLEDVVKLTFKIQSRYKAELETDAFSSGQREILAGLWRDVTLLRQAKKAEAFAIGRRSAGT